jgi:hypothetical protein
MTLEDFLFDMLDRAATVIDRTSADAYSTPKRPNTASLGYAARNSETGRKPA